MLTVERLRHGGIMANYRCTAACRHCLYACSPTRSGGYITKDTAKDVCALLVHGGCRSVHIGGGEPFLGFDGLLELIQAINHEGIKLEYIETNAFWAKDEEVVTKRLTTLANVGADTLCISLDPFHAEYIPVERPLYLAEMCARTGTGFFLWQQKYLPVLSSLNRGKVYTRQELEEAFSSRYVLETARSYGLHYGGRAVNIEEEFSLRKPVDEILDSKPCRGLLSTDHFHVDMHGRFIPPGCTGIAIPLDEAISGISESKYPVFKALLTGGVKNLFDYAKSLGFTADQSGYTSRCVLCFHIRHWLCKNVPCPELDAEHYDAALSDY